MRRYGPVDYSDLQKEVDRPPTSIHTSIPQKELPPLKVPDKPTGSGKSSGLPASARMSSTGFDSGSKASSGLPVSARMSNTWAGSGSSSSSGLPAKVTSITNRHGASNGLVLISASHAASVKSTSGAGKASQRCAASDLKLETITGKSPEGGKSTSSKNQRRFDPTAHLLTLFDAAELDSGYDWRLIDPKQWIEAKDKMIALGSDKDAMTIHARDLPKIALTGRDLQLPDAPVEGQVVNRKRIWAHLTTCLVYGTRQTIEDDGYPVAHTDNGEAKVSTVKAPKITWVDLSQYRRRQLLMTFFGASGVEHRFKLLKPSELNSLTGEVELEEKPLPVVCCAMSALDAAQAVDRLMKQFFERSELPHITVTLDADLNDALCVREGPSIYRKLNGRPNLEGFFMRSDAEAFIQEAAKRLAMSASSNLSDHFTAPLDPYILYCQDLVIFREGISKGYAFLESPLVVDMELFSMACSRPPWRKRKPHENEGNRAKIQGLPPEKEYAEAEHVKSLSQRLALLADSVLSTQRDHIERQNLQPPILVLALPGCMDRQSHPVAGVARLIEKMRETHANRFSAIIVACGENRLIAKQVDSIVNVDSYTHVKDNKFLELDAVIKANNWSPFLKCLLQTLSANKAWSGAVKQRDSFLAQLQAKEMVAKSHFGGKNVAELMKEEQSRQEQVHDEEQLSKDVHRLAAEYLRGPEARFNKKVPTVVRSGNCWGFTT